MVFKKKTKITPLTDAELYALVYPKSKPTSSFLTEDYIKKKELEEKQRKENLERQKKAKEENYAQGGETE